MAELGFESKAGGSRVESFILGLHFGRPFLQEVGPRGLLVGGSGAANLPAGVWWAVEESNGALRPWLNLYSPASSGLHGKLCRQRIFCGIVEFIHFHFGPQPQWLLYSSNFKI